jgi:glycosyltransferase involved in cell wall biosynthesis
MKREFEEKYGVLEGSIICSNAQYVTPISSNALKKPTKEIILGHLSNLGFGKGLAQVFGVCLRLKENGIPFKLILAGPSENSEARLYVDNIISELGDACHYMGQVNGESKNLFYSSIDIFLFPTNYKNEAQPNVLFEAHAFGVPTISTDIGCIGEDINSCNGFVFKSQQEYVDDAVTSITELFHDQDRLSYLRQSTLDNISRSSMISKESYNQLLSLLLKANY